MNSIEGNCMQCIDLNCLSLEKSEKALPENLSQVDMMGCINVMAYTSWRFTEKFWDFARDTVAPQGLVFIYSVFLTDDDTSNKERNDFVKQLDQRVKCMCPANGVSRLRNFVYEANKNQFTASQSVTMKRGHYGILFTRV